MQIFKLLYLLKKPIGYFSYSMLNFIQYTFCTLNKNWENSMNIYSSFSILSKGMFQKFTNREIQIKLGFKENEFITMGFNATNIVLIVINLCDINIKDWNSIFIAFSFIDFGVTSLLKREGQSYRANSIVFQP